MQSKNEMMITLHINEGHALKKENKLDEAIACYEKAIFFNENHAKSFFYKGNALYEQKKLSEAIECYDKAISIDSHYADSYFNKAVALSDLNKLSEAIACYGKAITIKPDDVDSHMNQGNAFFEQNSLQGAIACYSKALDINSSYALAYCKRGIAFEQNGKQDEAVADLKRAEELLQKGDLSSENLSLHRQLEKRRELEKSLEDVQAELSCQESDPRKREALGEVVTMVKQEIVTVFSKQNTILGQAQVQEAGQLVANIELKEIVKEVMTQAKEMVGVQGIVVDQHSEIEELKDRVHVLEEMFANLTAKNS